MEWNTETANIIYASNDGYAGHLAASLCSLLDNNGNIPLMDIYVLSVGMSRDYQERLACVAEKYNRRLYVLELGDLKERFDFDIDTLYETELENNLAGMVMEPTVYKEMKDSIGMGPDDPYYNSGVLLMDLEGWRREDVLRQLLNFYKSCRGRLFACEQDTINGTLRGRNHNHFRRLHEYYLDKTPWRGTPAQPGKELYMQLWWLFNQLSWLFPSFRLWVSRRMGMKLIDSRKKALAAGQGEGNH